MNGCEAWGLNDKLEKNFLEFDQLIPHTSFAGKMRWDGWSSKYWLNHREK